MLHTDEALVLLQDPLSTRACDAILPPMEAEVPTRQNKDDWWQISSAEWIQPRIFESI